MSFHQIQILNIPSLFIWHSNLGVGRERIISMAERYGTIADVLPVARKKQECICPGGQTPTSCDALEISALLKPSPFINSSSVVVLQTYLRSGGRQGGKALIQRIGCLSKIVRVFRSVQVLQPHHIHLLPPPAYPFQ